MRHNYQTCALQPESRNYWAHMLQLLKPVCPRAHAPQEKPPQWEAGTPQGESSPHSPQLEKARTEQWRPSTDTKYTDQIFINKVEEEKCIWLGIRKQGL